jgi:hypothetical protein
LMRSLCFVCFSATFYLCRLKRFNFLDGGKPP